MSHPKGDCGFKECGSCAPTKSELSPGDVITFIRQNPVQVLEALTKEHRTHQQATVGALSLVIAGYGKAADRLGTDLRNEAAVAWARTIEVQNFPFI
jgi:hypothetical protein